MNPDSDGWVHLAAVTGPGGMKLYVNGGLQGTIPECTDSFSMPGTGSVFRLGGHAWDGLSFSGTLDDIRIWGTERIPAQIRAGMHATITGTENGLAAAWDFGNGSGATLTNHGPDALQANLTGNAAVAAATRQCLCGINCLIVFEFDGCSG